MDDRLSGLLNLLAVDTAGRRPKRSLGELWLLATVFCAQLTSSLAPLPGDEASDAATAAMTERVRWGTLSGCTGVGGRERAGDWDVGADGLFFTCWPRLAVSVSKILTVVGVSTAGGDEVAMLERVADRLPSWRLPLKRDSAANWRSRSSAFLL